MSEPRSRSGAARSLLAVSGSLCVLVLAASRPAEAAEIDRLQIERAVSAIRSESKQGVLDFINTYPSSPVISTVLTLVSPEVAQQVCAEPLDGVSAVAQDACKELPSLQRRDDLLLQQLREREQELEKQQELLRRKYRQQPQAILIAS